MEGGDNRRSCVMHKVWGWTFHACCWCPKLPRVSNGLKWSSIWSSM